MHGPPPSWFLPALMTWPDLPKIKVVDTVAPTLRPRKARKWRDLRDTAGREWSKSGLVLVVTEEEPQTEFDRSYVEQGIPEFDEWSRHIIPGCVRLMTGKYINSGQGVAWSHPDTDPGSIVFCQINNVWWQSTSKWKQLFIVVHEIGHALGLNHRSDSKASVMYAVSGYPGNSNIPDLHDLDSLREYYT